MKPTLHSLLLSILLLLAAAAADEFRNPPDMPTNAVTPVCGEDEELFQLNMTIVEGTIWDYATYRVVTESINQVHDECVGCEVRDDNPADVRLCLPRDGCHTVFIGKRSRWISCFQGDDGQELTVSWGDKILIRSNAWLFDRIEFGEGCPAQPPSCDKDREVLFEFFYERDLFGTDNLSWALQETLEDDFGITKVTHLQGRARDQERSSVYNTACVPRDACLAFRVWNPNPPPPDEPYYDTNPISVRLDGVVYSERQLQLGGSEEVLERTILLGGPTCTVLCETDSEELFAMKYRVTQAPENSCSNNEFFESSSAVESWGAPGFRLEGSNDTRYVSEFEFHGFEINQKYAFLDCIPNEECATFRVDSDYQGDFSYRIFQNRAELIQREVQDGWYGNIRRNEGGTTTMVGVCAGAGTLSSKGAVVSSVFAVFALLVVWL